ncbi:UNVERIFIED_CONTAM: hypothetical protein GTU68_052125 [Idotea baltica]|nr:hypothetical protein [Idotea baltica]
MIKLEHVSHTYNQAPVVNDISLEIAAGETCVIVGSSGCGKSTTLRLLNKLLACSSGKIYVNDQNINQINTKQLRLRMGYAIQNTGLFPHWTVEHNIGVVPRLLGWSKSKVQNKVRELLELLSLPHAQFAHKFPHELSGGQAQRIGVARALAGEPEILLMDEPFGALDPITRETLQNELLRIQAHIHKTIMFVTHDIDEALKLATRIAVMDKGRIVQYDTPLNLLASPANQFVKNLLGQGEQELRSAALHYVVNFMQPATQERLAVNVQEQDTLRQALSYMMKYKVNRLCVRNSQNAIVGTLSFSDLIKG